MVDRDGSQTLGANSMSDCKEKPAPETESPSNNRVEDFADGLAQGFFDDLNREYEALKSLMPGSNAKDQSKPADDCASKQLPNLTFFEPKKSN